ncbi:MAG: transcription antitermination factor NusB [Fidelibacterota bacterium]|nr:MAG: transcription antitermination factor NusB [Candidatus Neomarinimicrobiota bacterium]
MALQCLYAASFGGDSPEEIVDFVARERECPPNDDARDYCLKLMTQTIEKQKWADQVITSKLEHWDLARLTLIDRLILELALIEMVNFCDVPLKVSISEAIEIAKRYSTDDSPGFINGILDAVYHDILDEKMEDGDQ